MKRKIFLLLLSSLLFALPIEAQVVISRPNSSVSLPVSVPNGGTGLTTYTVGGVLCPTASTTIGQVSAGTAAQVLTSNGAGACPTFQANAPGSGASTALDNLASVAINANLIPGTAGAVDLGSATFPFGLVYFSGTSATPGTNNFRLTGASTSGTRVITFPNSNTTVPIVSQILTISGPTAARTYTLPDANKTLLATDGIISALTIASQAAGDLLYASSTTALARLAIGTNGQCLVVTSLLPAWGSCGSSGGITIGTTTITSGTDTRALYNNAGVVGERVVTGTGNSVLSASPTLTGAITVTSSWALLGTSVSGNADGRFTVTNSSSSAGAVLDVSTNGTVNIRNLGDSASGILKTGTIQIPGSTSGVITLTASTTPSTYTFKLPDNAGTVDYVLRTDGSGVTSWVVNGSGAGATTALDNLASVAINTSLLAGTAGSPNIGSATKPFGVIDFAGTSGTPGTNNFSLTGASTSGTRTVTFPDSDTKIPISSQVLTFSGPIASRTFTLPDANKTLLATDGVISALTIASQAAGDILYASSTTALARLGIGTAGQCLLVTSSLPAWGACGTGLTVGTTAIASGTTTRILYDNAGTLGEYTIVGTGTAVAMSTAPVFVTNISTPSVITAAGADLAILSTINTQGASTLAGTAVTINSSNAIAGSSNAGAAAGGAITVTAGNAARLTSGNAAGGAITLLAGVGIGTSAGGAVNITGGVGGASGGAGGALVLVAGAGAGGAVGGAVNITAGAGNNTTGGAIALLTGASSAGNSGALTLTTAAPTSATAGAITLSTGVPGSGSTGGAINLTTGAGSNSATTAVGAINFTTGTSASTSTATGINGGLVLFTLGAGAPSSNASGTGGNGGTFTLTGGAGGAVSGTTSVTGGIGSSVTLTAGAGGAATGGSGTRNGGAGGNVTITTGAGGTGATANGASGSIALQVAGTTILGLSSASINIGTTLLISTTAPTISSGFGTSPSVPNSNSTAVFTVNVGTGGTATAGVVAMPTAVNGWACKVTDITTTDSFVTEQNAMTTTTVSVKNYSRTTGLAIAWTASDILQFQCKAY